MTNKEIFNELFALAKSANVKKGVVAAALVRDGNIIASTVSMDEPNRHAEDLLFEKVKNERKELLPTDTLYSTIQPCGRRTPGGGGEQFGDCTSKIVASPIKKVVYAVADPGYTEGVGEKLQNAGIVSEIVDDSEITEKARDIFNSTLTDSEYLAKKDGKATL